MKYIIILGDGMSDHAMDKLKGKTPLMVANTPNIDALCVKSKTGKLITVPAEFPAGSEVANLGVLGYDVNEVYQGRGVLEAASMGVALDETDLAMRCNLICVENDRIKNHSAGHISSIEASALIAALNQELGTDKIKFHPGVSYRHLLVIKDGINDIKCTPPHDVPGTPFMEVMVEETTPEGTDTASLLNTLILKSQDILKEHPINLARVQNGKDPANSIWPWAAGYKPKMKTFQDRFGLTGATISAVDLIKGIGIYAGMKAIDVVGATGLHDTNYEGKAKAAIEALKDVDFVYLHIEASDEAGHEGDVDLKIKTIEYLDERVVKYIVEETAKMEEPVTVAIIPDHPTPCETRTHDYDPVPFLIYKPGEEGDEVMEYNEEAVSKGVYGVLKGEEFIKRLF
ncbi:cofactor-independent phosphoglycerate mutase [bacterium]|nr:cofactor-independent phosphoglycerate mutase [bacterium]